MLPVNTVFSQVVRSVVNGTLDTKTEAELIACANQLISNHHFQFALAKNTMDNHSGDSTKVESKNESIEPILTEETLPNEPGEWDLRFNFDYLKHKNEIYTTLPEVQLFFGIFKNVGCEISLPLNYFKEEKAEYGFGSISTSVKWLALNQSAIAPAFVVGFDVGFPTNSFVEGSEERTFEYSPYIAFLKDLGQFCFQGNIALATEVPVSGGEKNHRTELNVAFAYPAGHGKVDLLAELNSAMSRHEKNEFYISPGFKYHLNSKHFLALAFPVGLYSLNSNFRMFIQYQFEL